MRSINARPLHPSLLPWRRFLCASLAFATLALGSAAQAATYYVSSAAAGSTNQGTLENPWTTVATVNAHGAFAAGDRILFKRGDTFDGAGLVVQGSGAAGDPITYGAYPDNADPRPIIDGNGATCVTISNRSWITVQDLDLSSPNAAAPLNATALTCNNGNHIEVRRVRSAFTAGSGLKFTQGGDILVAGCEVLQFGNGGIYLTGSDTLKLHDATVQDCLVHDARDGTNADGITIHNTGAGVGSNFRILRNTAYNCNEQGFDLTSGTNILLEHNESYANNAGGISVGHTASDVTIRYQYCHDEPTVNTAATVQVSVPNVTIEYSKFVGGVRLNDASGNPFPTTKPLLEVEPGPTTMTNPDGSTWTFEHQPENFVLRNNVFVWNSTAPGNLFVLGAHFTGMQLATQSLTMKNNLWTGRTPAVATMNFTQANRPPNFPGYDLDHNLYQPGVQWRVAGAPYDFPNYQSTFGRDPHGLSADPLFVNAAAGDFHLLPGSPAIDAGLDAGLAADFDGVAVPQGAGRDLGAFEFGVVIAAPTSLTATALSAHEVQLAWMDNSDNETAFRLRRKEGIAGAYADTSPATVAANTSTFSDTNGVAGSTTYFYQVRAETPDGTSAWSAEATATTPEADTTAPEITSLTATPDHLWPPNHQMVAVTLTATDTDNQDPAPVTKILSVTSSEADSGEPDWEITGDLTLDLRAERAGNGPGRLYTVTVQSTDSSGNSSTATVLIPVGHNNDTKAPTVALTAPANGALLGGNVGVAATASDNDGVVGVQFQLDGANLGVEVSSAPYGVAWNTTGVANGNHTLTAVARDENGNMATSAPVTVFVDNAPPAVAVTAPAAGSLLTGGGIVLSATATDNVAVAGVQFQLDGAAVGAELTAAPYELIWDSATVADGAHTLTATARDTLGNTAISAAVVVTTDNLAPVVALTAPAANAVVAGGAVTLTAAASDIVGVAGVQFQVDGVDVGAEDTTAPYSVVWNTTAASNGSHTLTAIARDGVGHTTESAPVSVTVDNVPPTVALTAPADGATVSGSAVPVSATAADDNAVASVQFKLDGVNLGAADTTAPYGVNWNSTTAANGAHVLTATARDSVGNTTTSAPVSVTVSNVVLPPVLFEAESQTITAQSASVVLTAAAGASNGQYVLMNSNTVGQSITYAINVPAGGSYVVVTGLATQGNRGIFQLQIDGVNQGATVDYYTPGGTAQFSERNLGTVTLTAGTHSFRFLLTGRNPAASNQKHALDYIKLIPQ